MSKPVEDLTGAQKVVAYIVIWVIVAVFLLLVGVGVIKFLQWAF